MQTKNSIILEDEEPKNFRKEKIFSLKPVFETNGTITGANASKINDGACTLLLMSEKMVQKHNFEPLAEILSF